MKRGDLVLAVARGDYGKPRPAVVVQSDLFNDTHGSFLVCLLTTELLDAPLFRLTVHPSPTNGLQQTSQIMVDKLLALPRDRVRSPHPKPLCLATRQPRANGPASCPIQASAELFPPESVAGAQSTEAVY